jgi:hypothetical protein
LYGDEYICLVLHDEDEDRYPTTFIIGGKYDYGLEDPFQPVVPDAVEALYLATMVVRKLDAGMRVRW